ncbi:hypothetical protein Kpol_1058p8 [Vanderwaltozyma polyspora DSM 70294]|uniref:Regulator of free ubiquitin chains 1 n=1 Tax=Vanderwaltozyma polyspora (strain ATCC 22028 / DSM 70294 / BCRC 21397 / CBS 2163 / NBRC 10782 / NRRL Y-8283 / UCD 57-17) TaxID=436907 RepID=RFU1_VANPO|nr:uncharacterized protein Kpol_1058p8 [Vanderwaltozyma polyspora DSM 70294]A7TJP2.1 RecName: Full=Regulator of free ubiquitin chains 1 [Vanderwaltozyma polyspora DSM 70294]EDO17471.1 hypothetical protein Kpol_1058p8 [Vanderwaltozyma polyspora DSM 70294]
MFIGMKSSSQLRQEALEYTYNANTPLKIYLKVCVSILDKAQLEFQKGDIFSAYVLYYRYADLIANKLSDHSELALVAERDQTVLHREEYYQLVKLELPAVLKIVEDLQKNIDLDYNKIQLSLSKNIAKQQKKPNHVSEPVLLPKTFNENRFNQSISFFNNMNSNITLENKMHGNNNNNTHQELLYPELPTLSNASYI